MGLAVHLENQDSFMALQWITGTVQRKHIWSEGLFTLTIHCPGVAHFEPGQFLQIGLALPEKHLHRPYSVASPHGESLDFFIVRVDEGELTPRLWKLEEGDTIDVSAKATGSFTLSHVPDAPCLWLVATGTGLAPYIAMLRDPTIWERFAKVVLVHGVRLETDLAYLEELDAYRHTHGERFKFLPVLSRQQREGCLHGRITHTIENGQLEEQASARLVEGEGAVMLCGNPQMLDDVEAILTERGMRKHKTAVPGHYVLERYW